MSEPSWHGSRLEEEEPCPHGFQSTSDPGARCPQCDAAPEQPILLPNDAAPPRLSSRSTTRSGILTGKILGEVRLERFIGAGGMGAVYQGTQAGLERKVAVKILPDELAANPTFVRKFEEEARAVARVNHPNVVQVFTVGTADTRRFLVMEYVDGSSLAQRLKVDGMLAIPEACRIIRDVARGLESLREQGIVHRDIKPHNIFITSKGVPKLGDFGLAKNLFDGESRSESRGLMGTAHYMSPEQIRGIAPDIRSDLYALGISFWECLTGRLPFEGRSGTELLKAHLEKPLPKLRSVRPDVPRRIARLIDEMTEKRPERRTPTPQRVIDELEDYLSELNPKEGATRRALVRKRTGVTVAATLAAVCCVVLAVWLFRGKPKPPEKTAAAPPAPVAVTPQRFLESDLVGQWKRDTGGRKEIVEFRRDRILIYPTKSGTWRLDGETLTRTIVSENMVLRAQRDSEKCRILGLVRGKELVLASGDGAVQWVPTVERLRDEDEQLRQQALQAPRSRADQEKDFALGYELIKNARYKESIPHFRRIFLETTDDSIACRAAYNLACAYAAIGERVVAMSWLDRSIVHGLGATEEEMTHLTTDQMLEPLRRSAQQESRLEDLYEKARKKRGFLGAVIVDHDAVFRISEVVAGTSADKAGLRKDDIILNFNGGLPSSDFTFREAIRSFDEGAEVKLRIKRPTETKDITVQLGARPTAK